MRAPFPAARRRARFDVVRSAAAADLSASILIVPAYPLHREFEAGLVAAFRRKIEVMVGTIEHINAPRVAGIGVEHLAPLVLIEHADSDVIRQRIGSDLVVVVHLALGNLFGRKSSSPCASCRR